MQQVLNSQQRTQSFLKFLLFFLITVSIIVFAIFFDFRMPSVENKKLKEEVYVSRQTNNSQEIFANKAMLLATLLDSANRHPEVKAQLSPQISHRLSELNGLVILEETGISPIARANKTTLESLIKVNELQDRVDKIRADYDQKIKLLQTQLAACQANTGTEVQVVR